MFKATYIDTFEHAFDEKGRITVPSEWRGEGFEANLVVVPSSEQCLKVYPVSWLAEQQAKLTTAGVRLDDPRRQAFEALAAISQAGAWDIQGRMIIKDALRKTAEIKRKAVLVGCSDHFKIWSAERYLQLPARAMTIEDAAKLLGI
jgi:MraZ protein